MNYQDRVAVIRRVLAQPPKVHGAAASGVWSTAESAYEFMASRCAPGARTLETGLGVSTVLFAAWGTDHTCVVPYQLEVDAVRTYIAELGHSDEMVRFEVGFSDAVLPALSLS